MAQAATSAPVTLPTDDLVVLRNVTWADYQRLLEMRGDSAVPRVTYLEGVIELMTPSRTHESTRSLIGRLVETWCMENDIDITAYGSWTLESKESERGAEPDECYVLGDVSDPTLPDLAIEVIWSSGSINKLDVYKKLGVREVWFWKKGRIQPYRLRGPEYEPVANSALLPELDLELLAQFINVKPMTRALRECRAALRTRASSSSK